MNRPKIICHILQSVDGNIDGGFFAAPVFAPAFQAFGRVRAEYACDAVVSGATFEAGDYRSAMPQYAGEAFEKNRALLELVRALAEEKGATPAQISLAWMLGKKPYIVPIPGSRKVERIRENLGAAAIALTPDEVKAIDARLDGMEMSAVFGGSPVKKRANGEKAMRVAFEGRKSVITPEGAFIIGTCDENGAPNAMNAAWGMQSEMGEITLMLSKTEVRKP